MRDEHSMVTQAAPEGGPEGGAPAASPVVDDHGARHTSFRPGARIADKYAVERLIGEGGLGVVVAARHLHLDQVVAIKSLRPAAMATKGVAERFLREARLAAKIRSEHVVRVYDVGTLPDGAPYMVMEYLAGTDLARQLSATGPLAVERAVDYVLQACEALAEAHVAGIVHRDIKPDNLFIATSAGGKAILKILDFGISKMSTRHTTSGNELTEAGDKFGTPLYMSPEQLLSSRDVDARTDVWAIGVVLYELLTAKLPFDGDLPELCSAIINKPPVPLGEVRAYLPEGLQAVVDKCLAKKLEDRYQNVAELAQDLRPLADAVSQARVDHVVHLIRGAGEAVRPSLLSIPPMQQSGPSLPKEQPTLADKAQRAATTGSGLGSWGTSPPRGRTERTRLIGVFAGTVALGVLAVFLMARGAQAPVASTPAPPPPAAAGSVGVAPQVAPVVVPVPPVSAAEPPQASGTASPEPSASARSVAATGQARKVNRESTSSKLRSPNANDPNAVINPFE